MGYDYSSFILVNVSFNKRDNIQPTLLYKGEVVFMTYAENSTNVRIGLAYEKYQQYIGKKLVLKVHRDVYNEVSIRIALRRV